MHETIVFLALLHAARCVGGRLSLRAPVWRLFQELPGCTMIGTGLNTPVSNCAEVEISVPWGAEEILHHLIPVLQRYVGWCTISSIHLSSMYGVCEPAEAHSDRYSNWLSLGIHVYK